MTPEIKRVYKNMLAEKGSLVYAELARILGKYYKPAELASLWNNIQWCEAKHQQCKTEKRTYTSTEYQEYESRNEQTTIEVLKLIDKIPTL
jgi:hypothetical protein